MSTLSALQNILGLKTAFESSQTNNHVETTYEKNLHNEALKYYNQLPSSLASQVNHMNSVQLANYLHGGYSNSSSVNNANNTSGSAGTVSSNLPGKKVNQPGDTGKTVTANTNNPATGGSSSQTRGKANTSGFGIGTTLQSVGGINGVITIVVGFMFIGFFFRVVEGLFKK